MSLPTDRTERKHAPMFSGLLAYFPDALFTVAAHSYASNEKHNPGEPLHWSRDKSADHKDCIVRHMTDIAATPGDIDFEIEELKACAWRSLAALQLAIEAKKARVNLSIEAEKQRRNAAIDRWCEAQRPALGPGLSRPR